jgi:hypothetical protein
MNLLTIIRDRISKKPIIPTVNDVNDTEKSHDAFGIEDSKPLKQKASSTPDPVDFVGQAPPVEISAADQVLIDWFFTANLPTQSFDLDRARRVFDPEKFFAAIRREIDTRQSSPRWKCGATQFDLELLRKLFGQEV